LSEFIELPICSGCCWYEEERRGRRGRKGREEGKGKKGCREDREVEELKTPLFYVLSDLCNIYTQAARKGKAEGGGGGRRREEEGGGREVGRPERDKGEGRDGVG
jgi:hypothetical protein